MDQSQTLDDRMARLQAFAERLVETRDAAVSFRDQTGVEKEWNEDEDYYNGKDPSNQTKGYTKGRTGSDGLQGATQEESGAEIFDNITAYHVDMRAARATDMLTPSDDKPFKINPSPEPELTKALEDPASQQQMVMNAQGQQTPMANAIELMMKEATESAENAERWIWDKFIEFNWHGEFRKCIHEAHKIGNWAMKGPFPVRRRFTSVEKQGDQIKFVKEESIEPASRAIDIRNLYPDPACYPSEDIQKGSFIWEKDEITYKQLAELRGLVIDVDGQPEPMYLDDQIDECLKEGPTPSKDKNKAYSPNPKDLFTIWYGYCNADHKDMEAAGCKCDEGTLVPAQITMVNDRVIQATLSALDGGEFPYDILRLDRRPGTPFGKGIARKVRLPQREVNGLERAWMKNAGLCAGPMMFFRRDKVFAADGGSLNPRPFGVFDTTDDVDDVRKALAFVETPSRQAELLQGVQFALQRGNELVGNFPQDQGQQSESPETAKGRILLQNNSNAPQRQIARNADDGVIKPHVKRYYNYWLKHADGDKGSADHQIEALGSTAMFERDAEQQFLLQVWASGLANNPDSRIDVNKLTVELMKGNKINPDRVRFSDEEWKARQEEMAKNPPPPPPNVMAAQVKAASDEKINAERNQVALQKAKLDSDRDTIYANAEAARSAENHDYNVQKLELEKSIAMLKENGASARTIDTLKTKLATVEMELKMQRELALGKADETTPQVAPSATEPPGRAPDGQAFQA